MARVSERELPIGVVMERSVRWGLPAAPLFAAMIQALSTTPASLSAADAGSAYLVCMAGALLGFVLVGLVRHWTSPARMLSCWGGAAALELAWIVLTIGEFCDLVACTQAGMALVGLSTAVLLCLWLSVDQWADMRCEIGKLSVALLCAFLVNAVLTTLPYLNFLSFALPVLTAFPLSLRLRDGIADPPVQSLRSYLRAVLSPRFAVAPLIATFGAGVGVLGFGGTIVDYAAVFGALALLVPLALGANAHTATGQLAVPLAITGLGAAILFDSGTPFSIYLSGSAACLAWLWMDVRLESGSLRVASPRLAAISLGFANVLAMGGLVIEQLAFHAVRSIDLADAAAILCVCLVVFDYLWRLQGLQGSRRADGMGDREGLVASAGVPFVIDEGALEQALGLSPREAQVARLLCENRSVNYICACLDLSRSTVKTHVRHIYEKAGVHSKDELQLLVRSQVEKGSELPVGGLRDS